MARMSAETTHSEHGEEAAALRTNRAHNEIGNVTDEHRQYLLDKHGHLDLDPVPEMNDADPYNWSTWKKCTNLALVAFHAMMSTFTAASIQSAFVPISEDLGISLQKTSYLVSLQIAVLGGAPLFWRPLSSRFGRRPIFIISLIGSLVCNIGCANSYSYATMGICRALVAWFISPAAAIGSAVVTETFFKRDRARYMGYWTLMVSIGVPISPFIFGFVALRVNYRWIYYILAITNGVQLLLYLFLGPETRYARNKDIDGETAAATATSTHQKSTFKQEYLNFTRLDPTPFTAWDFLQPLTFFATPCVLLPACAYAMIFGFGVILITIEIPQLYPVMFAFNTQQVGLQFIALVIGAVLGEQIGGFASDRWMAWRRKSLLSQHANNNPDNNNKDVNGAIVVPAEFRLWLSYLGYALTITGVTVFLVLLGEIKNFSVAPAVGAGIAAAGNQIVTTTLITYAVDCYREEAAGVGVFVTFVRQIWGFLGPFWFPQAIEHLGFGGAAGLMVGLMVGFSVLPTIFLQLRGERLR